MRVFVVLAMLLIPLAATAVPHDTADTTLADILLAQRGPTSLLPNQGGPRFGTKQAASRVKTLSADGVVKYVFVDGTTGDVFE